MKLDYKIAVIGLGPAGIGAALALSKFNISNYVICYDAGKTVETKKCAILNGSNCTYDEKCDMITGLGGSSVLAGGKISSFPAGRSLADFFSDEEKTKSKIEKALKIFGNYINLLGLKKDHAHEEVKKFFFNKGFDFRYYDAYLAQTDKIVLGYKLMAKEIESSGIKIKLGTTVTEIKVNDNSTFSIISSSNDNSKEVNNVENIIFATGRYGSNFINNFIVNNNVSNLQNVIDIGVRLEFPAEIWPDIDEYHNDLKLHFGSARTFCLCKNGVLAPYKIDDIFLLEGHSDPGIKSGLTNIAITIREEFRDNSEHDVFFKTILGNYKSISNGTPIRESLLSFIGEDELNKTHMDSSIKFWNWGNIKDCFPEEQKNKIINSTKYFVERLFSNNNFRYISVFGLESDYYWPKLFLSNTFESPILGTYFVGDSTGRFRGILQSFCSGYECAMTILGETDGV